MSTVSQSCLRGLLIVCLLLTITACNSSVNQQNFTRIEPGMTET